MTLFWGLVKVSRLKTYLECRFFQNAFRLSLLFPRMYSLSDCIFLYQIFSLFMCLRPLTRWRVSLKARSIHAFLHFQWQELYLTLKSCLINVWLMFIHLETVEVIQSKERIPVTVFSIIRPSLNSSDSLIRLILTECTPHWDKVFLYFFPHRQIPRT